MVLSQPGQVLQIQAPQVVTGSVVTMPTLVQDRLAPVAAPSLVTLCSPSADDDVSLKYSLFCFFFKHAFPPYLGDLHCYIISQAIHLYFFGCVSICLHAAACLCIATWACLIMPIREIFEYFCI